MQIALPVKALCTTRKVTIGYLAIQYPTFPSSIPFPETTFIGGTNGTVILLTVFGKAWLSLTQRLPKMGVCASFYIRPAYYF